MTALTWHGKSDTLQDLSCQAGRLDHSRPPLQANGKTGLSERTDPMI
jgi:hypothetical protein